jgi:hypothetical protein
MPALYTRNALLLLGFLQQYLNMKSKMKSQKNNTGPALSNLPVTKRIAPKKPPGKQKGSTNGKCR